jgi:hypothetical protein
MPGVRFEPTTPVFVRVKAVEKHNQDGSTKWEEDAVPNSEVPSRYLSRGSEENTSL